jgi:hypothetical protein
MTRVVVDAETWAKLSNPHEVLEVCDQSGRTLVYSQPLFRVGSVEDGKIKSPYSVEEVEELTKQTGGRCLADILSDLSGRKNLLYSSRSA